MFLIDISRWMILSRCRWISVYLPWLTAHAFEPLPLFCSIVSIVVWFKSCQLPSCDLFTSLALLSSFGWETSLVKSRDPGPYSHHCLHPQFTFCLYFQLPLLSLALILCKQQGRRNWQLLWTRWEQSYLLCVKVQVKLAIRKRRLVHFTTYLYLLESYWLDNLGIFTEGN